MNGNEMLDILGKIDPKLVKQSQKPPVIRWVALVACLVLIIGITAMLLRPGASPAPSNPVLQAPTEPSPTVPSVPTSPITPSTLPSDPTEPSTVPSDPTVPNNPPAIQLSPISLRDFTIDPQKITGVQHLGSITITDGSASEPPLFCFWINLVVQARVLEILPNLYQDPLTNQKYHILRMETLDVINGQNFPQEFYLRLDSYLSTELECFDSLILSLEQVGIENQLMINTNQHTMDSFSLLFQVYHHYAPYFGSVVAFTDGVFAPSLFKMKGWSNAEHYLEDILSDEPPKYMHDYPAKAGYTPADTKAEINNRINNSSAPERYRDLTVYTQASFPHSEVFDYVKTGLFAHFRPGNPVYTRIVNGFPTTERIIMLDDTVTYEGEAFTQLDLQAMPDIGAFIEDLNLNAIDPPHIEDTSNLNLHSCGATGLYTKVDGQVYGVVKIFWTYFEKDTYYSSVVYDGLYYLATTDGTIRPIERDELTDLIGKYPPVGYGSFIDQCEYGTGIELPQE